MRAIRCNQYGPPESLVLETLPDLRPGADEVVIDVRAASVNFPDVLVIQNKYQTKPALPFTPGAEFAGVVREVGTNVSRLSVGMRVAAYTAQGAFAEQAVAREAACIALPEDIDFASASAVTLAYGTSHHAVVDRGGLKAGETMLVLGAAGGVGLAAVEIGKALGARVIAAASSAEKLALCVEHGADSAIDYSSENLRERIKELTDGKGPDVIYDPVGGEYAEPAFRSIGWRGRYLVVGFANGEIPRLALNLTLLKGASIVGVFWGPAHTTRTRARRRSNEADLWLDQGTPASPAHHEALSARANRRCIERHGEPACLGQDRDRAVNDWRQEGRVTSFRYRRRSAAISSGGVRRTQLSRPGSARMP